MTLMPNRVAASSPLGDPSLPNATRKEFRHHRHEPASPAGSQQLAGVVEPGRAERRTSGRNPDAWSGAPERARCGRTRAGARPAIKEFVWNSGMAEYPTSSGSQFEHHGHAVPGGQQASLGAADGLGGGRGARREQQDPQVIDVPVRTRRECRGRCRGSSACSSVAPRAGRSSSSSSTKRPETSTPPGRSTPSTRRRAGLRGGAR